jgi:integrase/recombinase XerD
MSRHTVLSERAWINWHEGPLGAHIDAFTAWLEDQGYARFTVRYFVRLAADLSRWLARQGLGLADLQPARVEAFAQIREKIGCLRPGDTRMLQRLLGFLQSMGAVDPPCPPPVQATPIDRLCADFARYLREERGLSDATLKNYLPSIQRFLSWRFGAGPLCLGALDGGNVSAFVLEQTHQFRASRVKLVVTALRSFLRFGFVEGIIGTDLSRCVPTVPLWRLRGLPRALAPQQIEQVLAHCDRTTAVGKRDYAVLVLLARLGLRAGEVAALRLDDLHWRKAEILVHGKGASCDGLPLTREVGEALVDYLAHGRPKCASRALFLRARAPLQGLVGAMAVCTLVKRALERAGLDPPSKGAHQFRHGLACSMLRQGGTLEQIGEILRHRHADTTTLYAKVDLPRLRPLAAPWPGGAA